jgi:hypothetical protein
VFVEEEVAVATESVEDSWLDALGCRQDLGCYRMGSGIPYYNNYLTIRVSKY